MDFLMFLESKLQKSILLLQLLLLMLLLPILLQLILRPSTYLIIFILLTLIVIFVVFLGKQRILFIKLSISPYTLTINSYISSLLKQRTSFLPIIFIAYLSLYFFLIHFSFFLAKRQIFIPSFNC
jgi:hypothetical protein